MSPASPTNRDILDALQMFAGTTEERLSAQDEQLLILKDLIATSHDQIIGRLERVEQEMTFIHVTLQRHEEALTYAQHNKTAP